MGTESLTRLKGNAREMAAERAFTESRSGAIYCPWSIATQYEATT